MNRVPRRPVRRPLHVVLVAAVLAVLTACSTPLPVPQPDAVPAATPPALTAEQAEEVLADLDAVLEAADAERSTEVLAQRVTGPAARVRALEYGLAAAGDAEAVTEIPAGAQTLVLPTTDAWPRTFMAVTPAPEDLRAPLLLTMVQEAPREPYRLWAWSRLFPGVEMPPTAQPEVGSPPVVADSEELAVPPLYVVGQYVDVLTNGAESPYAASYADDPLRGGILQTRDAFAGLVGENGSLSQTYRPLDEGRYALATAEGGAIVVGAFETVTTITLADSTLTISDPQTRALLGKETVASTLSITWLSVVAFEVPPAGTDAQVEMLGAEHTMIQVTGE